MSDPVIRTNALRVRDERGAIQGLDLALPAGPVGALIGSPADGTTALSSALAGAIRPHGGSLSVGGIDPRRSPDLRRRMGVLTAEPDLPDVGRVRDLLTLTRSLRGKEAPRETWFAPLGLDSLAPRRIQGLNRREKRTVALGLALAVAEPVAIVLFDPLGDVLLSSADTLRPLIQERANRGACVLIFTPSARDAAALANDVATLQRGLISRAMGQPDLDVLTPGSPVELHVWCNMQRAFSSALLLESEITSLTWSHDVNAPLRVHGTNMDECARAVVRVAVELGVTINAIQAVVPSAPEIHAATEGMALAARQQAAYAASIAGRGQP